MYQKQRTRMTPWSRWGVLLIVIVIGGVSGATQVFAWSVDFIWYPSDNPAAVGTCLAGTPTTFEASLSGSGIPASVSYTWFLLAAVADLRIRRSINLIP